MDNKFWGENWVKLYIAERRRKQVTKRESIHFVLSKSCFPNHIPQPYFWSSMWNSSISSDSCLMNDIQKYSQNAKMLCGFEDITNSGLALHTNWYISNTNVTRINSTMVLHIRTIEVVHTVMLSETRISVSIFLNKSLLKLHNIMVYVNLNCIKGLFKVKTWTRGQFTELYLSLILLSVLIHPLTRITL